MNSNTLYIASLNSGSNGNCYYVGNDQEAVLIDAGISCRETETRMQRLGLPIDKVKAIFISHEHSDHVRGLCVLSKKYNLPVYINDATLGGCKFSLPAHLIRTLISKQETVIGRLRISPFPKLHDAAEPHSFLICCENTKVGVFTDIGAACSQLIHHFQQCHAAFLETNYDESMLRNSPYPYFLKKRITGGMGHLSNTQALELFKTYRPPFMSHLLLSHLSRENNCPQLVEDLFNRHASGTQIVVAGRYAETPVFKITACVPFSEPIAS